MMAGLAGNVVAQGVFDVALEEVQQPPCALQRCR
jgi:hypothetical protein